MIKPDEEVRLSDYTIMGPLPEDETCVIAINTLRDSVALLGRRTVDAIARGIRMDDPLHARELEELAESGIIVSRQKNEIYSLKYTLMNAVKPRESASTFMVFPTMGCNLACPYCYAWRSAPEHMSDDTAIRVTEWIRNQIEERKLEAAALSFCGGEPLLLSSLLLAMTREVSALCHERGIGLAVDLLSNGVMLTDAFVQQMLDCNATSGRFAVQITLDGPEELHNGRRTARDGGNSFQTIMRNLHDLACLDTDVKSRLKISVRINVDRQNLDSLTILAEQLQPLVSSGVVASVYLARTDEQGVPHDQYVMSMDEWLAVIPPLWYRIAETYGMDVSMQYKLSPCIEFKEMGTLIGSDGSLYTCQAFAGDHSFAIGHIDTGLDTDAYHEHYGLMPWDECIGKCSLIAWCWGGCRQRVRNATGDWKGRLCQKQTLIDHGLAFHRFKHRDHIARWLYNRANGIETEDSTYYKEITVSNV